MKWAYQRVVRGWDDRALWSIDDHLAATLGAQLVIMSETTCGYPGEDYPYEKWTADLAKHGNALLVYQQNHYKFYGDDWDAIYKSAQEALVWVAENLGKLWD